MEYIPPEKGKPGRPKGSISKRSQAMIEAAQQTGKLPHEILLDIARGEPQPEITVNPLTGERVLTYVKSATLEQRITAAGQAAPYYAPKLATMEVLQGFTDDGLDSIIAQLAAEAGVSLTADGEGETSEGAGEEAGTRPRRRIRLPE